MLCLLLYCQVLQRIPPLPVSWGLLLQTLQPPVASATRKLKKAFVEGMFISCLQQQFAWKLDFGFASLHCKSIQATSRSILYEACCRIGSQPRSETWMDIQEVNVLNLTAIVSRAQLGWFVRLLTNLQLALYRFHSSGLQQKWHHYFKNYSQIPHGCEAKVQKYLW